MTVSLAARKTSRKSATLSLRAPLVIDRYGHEILKHYETHCSLEAGVRANGDGLRA